MTQEDKELLLKDLCARTLYGVICLNKVTKEIYELCYITSYNEISLDDRTAVYYSPDDIIPYLRPMSSMTEEEKKVYRTMSAWGYILESKGHRTGIYPTVEGYKWLNANHFDYNHLIEKGLALPAPEGMYKEK